MARAVMSVWLGGGIDDLQTREYPAIEPSIPSQEGVRLMLAVRSDEKVRDDPVPPGRSGLHAVASPHFAAGLRCRGEERIEAGAQELHGFLEG